MIKGRIETLLRSIVANDPNDDAADAVPVLDVWRKEARYLLMRIAKDDRARRCAACGSIKFRKNELRRLERETAK